MKYATIVADPPWPFAWSSGGGMRRNGRGEWHTNGRARQGLTYPVMSVDAIAALDVRSLVDPEGAHLYLWTPDAFLLDGSAKRVTEAWGFVRPRLFVWHKTNWGLGSFPRPQHEVCLVATSATGRLPFRVKNVGSVQTWPCVYEKRGRSVAKKHSAKPEAFFDTVEAASPGPYLELFARRARFGWDYWGDESLETAELTA